MSMNLLYVCFAKPNNAIKSDNKGRSIIHAHAITMKCIYLLFLASVICIFKSLLIVWEIWHVQRKTGNILLQSFMRLCSFELKTWSAAENGQTLDSEQ